MSDLRNATLDDLAQTLHSERARALDVVAPAAAITAYEGHLVIAGTEVELSEDGVTPTAGTYLPTAPADGQLAEALGIPSRYLATCRRNAPELYDANINGWLHGYQAGRHGDAETDRAGDSRKFLLRILRDEGNDTLPGVYPRNGVVRAFLSDSYRIIDNLDVLLAVLAGIRASGVETHVHSCDLTDRRMYLRVSAPGVQALAPELLKGYRSPFEASPETAVRMGEGGWTLPTGWRNGANGHRMYAPGDEPITFAGFVASDSETGFGRFSLTPAVVMQICGNGLTLTAEALNKTHLGAKLDEGVISWSAETQQKNLELVKLQTRDAVAQFLDGDWLRAKVAALEEIAGAPVRNPDETIKIVAKDKALLFSDAEARSILEHFILGGQLTAGGIAQAVSSVAQTVIDGDDANALEGKAVRAMTVAAAYAGR